MVNVSLATARDVIAMRTNTNTPDRQIGVALFAEGFVQSCSAFYVRRFASAVQRGSVEIALE